MRMIQLKEMLFIIILHHIRQVDQKINTLMSYEMESCF